MKIKVCGYSDDLIEIDGDLSEEFTLPSDEKALLFFSDGTVLRIVYDNEGMWRINRKIQGTSTYTITAADNPEENYSDVAVLEGDNLVWCGFGESMVKAQ